MSQFGGTALAALAQGSQNQQAQAGTISDIQGLAQRGFSARGQVAQGAANTAVQGLAAAGRTEQAGLRTLQSGANSVQGAFSQLFQAKFQRDMERTRADRQFRLEDSRKKTAEANDSQRIQGVIQARLEQMKAPGNAGALRLQGLRDELVRLPNKTQADKDARASLQRLITTIGTQRGDIIGAQEALLEDFQQNDIDKLNGVPGARSGAHALTGRFIVGSEAQAQLDPRHKATIEARGGYGLREDLRSTERLRKHELTVSRHFQLGIVQDMKSLTESMKNGKMSDLQVAQKLMASTGVPQIARLSDIVRFSIGGEGTREDREELLSQFQILADSGELDVSTIRGYIGGLDQLLELTGNSIVAAAAETDMDPEDQEQVMRVAFELRRSLAAIEISTGGVSQGIKRDRVSIFQEALLNGHPASVETEVKVFKVLSDAQTLFPQLMEMLTIGTEPVKTLAIKTLAGIAGMGPGGEQEGDVVRSALDATIQTGGKPGGSLESFIPSAAGPSPDFIQRGMERVGLEGLSPDAGPGETVLRGGASLVGGVAQAISPGLTELIGISSGSGRQGRKFSIQQADSKSASGKRTLRKVVNDAQHETFITRAQATRLKGRIERGTLDGEELLAFLEGIRIKRGGKAAPDPSILGAPSRLREAFQ